MNDKVTPSIEGIGEPVAEARRFGHVRHDGNPQLFSQRGLLADVTERMRQVMDKRNISQADLARVIGCSTGHVSMVLNGTRNMTLRTLEEFARALGCEVRIKLVRVSSPLIGERDASVSGD